MFKNVFVTVTALRCRMKVIHVFILKCGDAAVTCDRDVIEGITTLSMGQDQAIHIYDKSSKVLSSPPLLVGYFARVAIQPHAFM